MKSMLKLLLVICILFASTFIVMKLLGVLSVEQVKAWLEYASSIAPIYLAFIVVLLLFLDLFIAMPTLTIMILSGYFLGHYVAAITVFIGVFLAALGGYFISRFYGYRLMTLLLKDESQHKEAIAAFNQNGFMMIMLARALPILPEATACMAGITRMHFIKFLGAWMLGAVPYILIATYAGSLSSLANPKPAIAAALGLSAVLWLCWWGYWRVGRREG